jgi:hypothetical protein
MTSTASAMDEISAIQTSVKASWKQLEAKKQQLIQEHDKKRQQLSKTILEGFGVPSPSEIQNLRSEWWSITSKFKSQLEALTTECDDLVSETKAAVVAIREAIDAWANTQAQELLSAFPGMHDQEAVRRVKSDNIGREFFSREQAIGYCLIQASHFSDDNAALIERVDAELREKSASWRVV